LFLLSRYSRSIYEKIDLEVLKLFTDVRYKTHWNLGGLTKVINDIKDKFIAAAHARKEPLLIVDIEFKALHPALYDMHKERQFAAERAAASKLQEEARIDDLKNEEANKQRDHVISVLNKKKIIIICQFTFYILIFIYKNS